MNDFTFYFSLGWQHIISISALDHILFLIALAARYLLKDWKKVLVLITAFTIGHSLTLALSVYDILRLNSKWVEFLIPVTIIITAALNFFDKRLKTGSVNLNYLLALFFGLIHGLGFANTIRFILVKSQTIGWPLFGFNLGLEAGQVLLVAFILIMSEMVINFLNVKNTWWIYGLSGCAFIIALKLAIERFIVIT